MISESQHIKKGDDVWVPTVCAGCYNCCGIKVRRKDGKIVEVAGDENAAKAMDIVMRRFGRPA